MQLSELVPGMELVGKEVLVSARTLATTKKGDPYLRLSLRDSSKELPAMVFQYDPAGAHHEFKEGDVIAIDAVVDTYNGSAQLKVSRTSPSLTPATAFAKNTRFGVETLWNALVEIVGSFQEPMTKWVAEELLLKNGAVIEAFKKAPAARGVHNAWFGGLLEHVWSLCSIAGPLIEHYQTKYCQKLSRDKVMFGLIMHDAGKIIEYDYSTPAFNMTGIGVLTNHMVLGPAWVYEKCNEWAKMQPAVPPNFKLERAHLMHVLAAHHGRIEWGSPVTPATLEAVLVHHLDNLDSKFMHALELIEGAEGPIAGFSERSYYEKTPFLRG